MGGITASTTLLEGLPAPSEGGRRIPQPHSADLPLSRDLRLVGTFRTPTRDLLSPRPESDVVGAGLSVPAILHTYGCGWSLLVEGLARITCPSIRAGPAISGSSWMLLTAELGWELAVLEIR